MTEKVILLTGSSGFLGQYIIHELQMAIRPKPSEIRLLDKKPLILENDGKNVIFNKEDETLKHFTGDLSDINDTEVQKAFLNVDYVIHTAAYVSYEAPTNNDVIQQNNVNATKNVISLCVKNNISRLIFTSTAEVAIQPFFQTLNFSVIVNQTEKGPVDSETILLGEYVKSKYIGELLILDANKSILKSGEMLKTVALRPTLMYGKGDNGFLKKLGNFYKKFGCILPELTYTGSLVQTTYVGNVAWAHVCALRMLDEESENISGLPILITDSSPITDLISFAVHCNESATLKNPENQLQIAKIKKTLWLPAVVSYALGYWLEKLLVLFGGQLDLSPTILVTYLTSVVSWNIQRASLRLQYKPKYEFEDFVKDVIRKKDK